MEVDLRRHDNTVEICLEAVLMVLVREVDLRNGVQGVRIWGYRDQDI